MFNAFDMGATNYGPGWPGPRLVGESLSLVCVTILTLGGLVCMGFYEYFALGPGTYEVNECVKLGVVRRYCIRVYDDATYEEIECPTNAI